MEVSTKQKELVGEIFEKNWGYYHQVLRNLGVWSEDERDELIGASRLYLLTKPIDKLKSLESYTTAVVQCRGLDYYRTLKHQNKRLSEHCQEAYVLTRHLQPSKSTDERIQQIQADSCWSTILQSDLLQEISSLMERDSPLSNKLKVRLYRKRQNLRRELMQKGVEIPV